MKLSEDSRKYGADNTCTSGNTLSKAALNYARSRSQIEKERGTLLRVFGTQVAEPLRAMVMGAPLEDARHLAQHYDKMRQEVEAQAFEVSRRQQKVREAPGNVDNSLKLESVESKLQEFKSNMSILGKEAVVAMTAVEAQQQRRSLQRLIAMIESERSFHHRVLQILEQLGGEIICYRDYFFVKVISEHQRIEASPAPTPPSQLYDANGLFSSNSMNGSNDSTEYFIAEVLHSHMAETDVELSLSVGDYVVVRKSYREF